MQAGKNALNSVPLLGSVVGGVAGVANAGLQLVVGIGQLALTGLAGDLGCIALGYASTGLPGNAQAQQAAETLSNCGPNQLASTVQSVAQHPVSAAIAVVTAMRNDFDKACQASANGDYVTSSFLVANQMENAFLMIEGGVGLAKGGASLVSKGVSAVGNVVEESGAASNIANTAVEAENAAGSASALAETPATGEVPTTGEPPIPGERTAGSEPGGLTENGQPFETPARHRSRLPVKPRPSRAECGVTDELGNIGCFAWGTRLLTPLGSVAIQEFRRGDVVLAPPERSKWSRGSEDDSGRRQPLCPDHGAPRQRRRRDPHVRASSHAATGCLFSRIFQPS